MDQGSTPHLSLELGYLYIHPMSGEKENWIYDLVMYCGLTDRERRETMGEFADMLIDQYYDDPMGYWDGMCDEGDEYDGPSPSSHWPVGHGPCPICSSTMHLANGPYGGFWGCDRWPKCKGARYINNKKVKSPAPEPRRKAFKEKTSEKINIQEQYDRAPRCPHCGDKQGFSWGTGDCGCETSFEVGF
jgi:hypothetical protein